jgi:hypothetical protein
LTPTEEEQAPPVGPLDCSTQDSYHEETRSPLSRLHTACFALHAYTIYFLDTMNPACYKSNGKVRPVKRVFWDICTAAEPVRILPSPNIEVRGTHDIGRSFRPF